APVRVVLVVHADGIGGLVLGGECRFPLSGVGRVQAGVELAPGGFREAVVDIQVVTLGLDDAEVLRDEEQLHDLRVAGATREQVAVRLVTFDVALVEDVAGGRRRERVLDLDVPPVQRDVEAFNVRRAVDQAQRGAGGGLRARVRVAAQREREQGLAEVAEALVGLLDEVVRHAIGGTVGRDGGGAAGIVARADVAELDVAVGQAAVQAGDRRRTEALGPVTADQQVFDRLPLEAELAVHGIAEVAVVGVARSHAELEQLGARNIGQERNQELGVDLVEVIGAFGRLTAVTRRVTSGHERVRAVETAFLARLDTGGEAHHAARQLRDLAAEVGREALAAVLERVLRSEQVVVHVLGGLAAGWRERVERRATVDNVGARLRLAVYAPITQVGGTDTQCDVAHVGVADLRVFLVGLVEVVADVPVEVAVGELEGTFQADIGVERLDVLLVDTRLLG